MTRPIKFAWICTGLISAVVLPLRIAEIVAAHQPGLSICVATARDASLPAMAVSHTKMNTGNLKDE